jgi:[acyl-carrier-protein] S-malonyltransferase
MRNQAMTIAAVFPGQGSQSVGMLAALAAEHPTIRATFAEASEAISLDLWAMAQDGPEDYLGRTENTQPALLAAGVAVYRAWLQAGGAPAALMCGHSLGEYSALVCANALGLADATRLVKLRGELMQQAVPVGVGAMAAVLNAELSVIEQACQDASEGEVIQPANLNAPGQIVISGHASALERTLKLLAERGVRKAIKLPVSVPSHSELMRPAAEKLAAALANIDVRMPSVPVIHNVSASPVHSPAEIVEALVAQLYSRVRWIECVQQLQHSGASRALECGPGKALSGMIKRIAPELVTATLAEPSDFNAALQI